MTTFQERYCAARQCSPEDFARALFWQCLHRHALPIALLRREFFAADWELVVQAGRARNLRELNEEIREFVHDGRNRIWWRGRAHFRLSTHRLRNVARQYLQSVLPLPLDNPRRRVA